MQLANKALGELAPVNTQPKLFHPIPTPVEEGNGKLHALFHLEMHPKVEVFKGVQ